MSPHNSDSNPAFTHGRSPRQEIMALLSERIGLNIHSVGYATIDRAITQAIKQSGQEEEVYLKQIKTSKATLDALIEAVVVPETHFFRNPESFTYLLKYAHQEKKRHINGKFLRVLSLPCSSGEEPYSIAVTLMEAGWNPTDFHIDGIDISQQALSIARQAIYKSYSFRNTTTFSPQYYRNKYFTSVSPGHYQPHTEVRSRVKFHQGNLSDVVCLPTHSSYDIIFCRNLLIYFHPSAREQALSNLDRLLLPNGLLFVGYAETRQIKQHIFRPLPIPQAFVFQKLSKQILFPSEAFNLSPGKTHVSKNIQTIRPTHQTNSEQQYQEIHITKNKKSNSNIFPSSNPNATNMEAQIEPQKVHSSDPLTEIRELANNGELVSALEQCDTYLKVNPTSAEGYLLLGEIYQAQGSDARADIAFQKVLYLNPNCIEALTHRLLLCEQQTNQRMAENLRQRIDRLTQQQREANH